MKKSVCDKSGMELLSNADETSRRDESKESTIPGLSSATGVEREDAPNRVTFKEFWALCMAHYRLAFAELGLLLLMLGVGYGVVWLLFLR